MNPTPTNIPTPRTDAESLKLNDSDWPDRNQYGIMRDFARTLERENIALREAYNLSLAERKGWQKGITILQKERDELKAENESLRKELNERAG